MFRISMLPARFGDCLWTEYGRASYPRRMLIDGGLVTTSEILRARLSGLLTSQRHFDLMAVTHVDADHIEGLITLMADTHLKFTTEDFWFNAWQHLAPSTRSLLGPVQGEYLSAMITDRGFAWHQAFQRGPVVINGEELPEITLDGGMKITLLSPDTEALLKLRRVWKREVEKAGLEPGNIMAARARLYRIPRLLSDSLLGAADPNLQALAQTKNKKDESVANGSSIAFLAEFEGKACLYAADAQPQKLLTNIQRLLKARRQERLSLDAFKIAHHGGSKNLTQELVDIVDCQRYLFSSNGERYGHPEKETIARVLTGKRGHCRLVFNYRTWANEAWDDVRLKDKFDYSVDYPENNEQGITIDL